MVKGTGQNVQKLLTLHDCTPVLEAESLAVEITDLPLNLAIRDGPSDRSQVNRAFLAK